MATHPSEQVAGVPLVLGGFIASVAAMVVSGLVVQLLMRAFDDR